MNENSPGNPPFGLRQWSAAERAAFARHENEQRRREARELDWTQKLECLAAMSALAYSLRPDHPPR